jgi:hypothetical protein
MAIQWHEKLGKWSYGFWDLAALSFLVLIGFLVFARRIAKAPFTITASRSMNAEALNYVATYILPFLDSRPDDLSYATGLGIFYFVLGLIYVNSNMIHINPVLNVLGFRLFEVEVDGTTLSLITRRRFIARNTMIYARRLGDDVLLETK